MESEHLLEEVQSRTQVSAGVRAWMWRAVVPLLVLLLFGAFVTWAGIGLGRWLVAADRLEHAWAVVVLSGGLPFRAMEAASIYRQGWTPEVWVTRPARPTEEAALARLGIKVAWPDAYNEEVLGQLGVPVGAIRLLNEEVRNTAEEVQVIARELKRMGGEQVILVTSKPHTRRVRAIWRALVGDSPHAIVRYAADDPYDPGHWWRHTEDALAVSREVFGLMNVWAGFPVQPDRR